MLTESKDKTKYYKQSNQKDKEKEKDTKNILDAYFDDDTYWKEKKGGYRDKLADQIW